MVGESDGHTFWKCCEKVHGSLEMAEGDVKQALETNENCFNRCRIILSNSFQEKTMFHSVSECKLVYRNNYLQRLEKLSS